MMVLLIQTLNKNFVAKVKEKQNGKKKILENISNNAGIRVCSVGVCFNGHFQSVWSWKFLQWHLKSWTNTGRSNIGGNFWHFWKGVLPICRKSSKRKRYYKNSNRWTLLKRWHIKDLDRVYNNCNRRIKNGPFKGWRKRPPTSVRAVNLADFT